MALVTVPPSLLPKKQQFHTLLITRKKRKVTSIQQVLRGLPLPLTNCILKIKHRKSKLEENAFKKPSTDISFHGLESSRLEPKKALAVLQAFWLFCFFPCNTLNTTTTHKVHIDTLMLLTDDTKLPKS